MVIFGINKRISVLETPIFERNCLYIWVSLNSPVNFLRASHKLFKECAMYIKCEMCLVIIKGSLLKHHAKLFEKLQNFIYINENILNNDI